MKRNEAEFNEFATNYREIHTANVHNVSGADSEYFSMYKIKELFRHRVVSSQSRWLDLGCGDGASSYYVKKYFPYSSYVGIDVSENSIQVAKERHSGCDFIVYNGNIIPFEEGAFDVIFISCVLHHIPVNHRANILKECYRVCKKGGKIVVFEHNINNPVTRKVVDDCIFDKDAVFLKTREVQNLLSKAGFVHRKCKYTIFIPRKGILKRLCVLEEFLHWCPFGGQYYFVAEKQ